MCLANSYKHSNRCVAGIDLATGTWLRPISHNPDGSLEAQHYILSNGDEPQVLDLLEIEFTRHCPKNCHPEDWHFSEEKWRLVERPIADSGWSKLKALASKSPSLVGGFQDRIYARRAEAGPLKESLALIKPEDLWWWVRRSKAGQRKYRALFRYHRVRYDLALTDPMWMNRLQNCVEGVHPHEEFFSDPPETLLTISLSEVFEGFHYKLVAGVICHPGHLPNSQISPVPQVRARSRTPLWRNRRPL